MPPLCGTNGKLGEKVRILDLLIIQSYNINEFMLISAEFQVWDKGPIPNGMRRQRKGCHRVCEDV